ncbi:hypothetical protein J2Z60_001934 [Lactobacillus colini]|uniref:Uncharacterized protein n=1 Tax=Lactobacillus colini TaxID=1819254 RepID=A0ABS4MGD1_9LACO|nr:hypothetical protein [Lactobacillus colini]
MLKNYDKLEAFELYAIAGGIPQYLSYFAKKVSIADDPSFAIFGGCRWKNETISRDILEKLIINSDLFNYPVKYYYLFSKVGFTKDCHQLAKEVGCKLISFDEM